MSSPTNSPVTLDLDALRARLASAKGPEFWRSLEQVAETPAFQKLVDDEFAPGTSEWTNPVNRRRVLELLGATLGLAGLTACTKQPEEKIVPYVQAPEDIIPGKPLYFASAITRTGYATGVLVESHTGRPTRIDGNPEHPASLGAADVTTQAAVLGMWDPDRSQTVLREGRVSTFTRFQEAAKLLREGLLSTKGANFRILTETVTSPTLAAQIRELLAEMPEAKWHQYEPCSRDNIRAGAMMAFGEPVNTVYNVDQADVVVALDSDFLYSGPGSLRYARQFVSRRKGEGASTTMNRLYSVETSPSITGAKADHRLPLSAIEVENFARALAAETGAGTGAASTKAAEFLKAVAADLNAHKGASLVIAGEHASPAVHALAHAINAALGNVGKTVYYTAPVESNPVDAVASLKELIADMGAGKVNSLLILGGNPMYDAPVDLGFAEAFRKVKLRIRLGEYDDETSAVCHWHIPQAHPLESWGEARAFDGTVTFQQPLVMPIYEGKTALEIVTLLRDKGGRSGADWMKEYWGAELGARDKTVNIQQVWEKSLHDGVLAESALAAKTVAVRKELAAELGAASAGSGVELLFRPCPNVFDGRYANNSWLQELPRPITKTTWDNLALMSPKMAAKFGVEYSSGTMFHDTPVVDLKLNGKTVKAPAWIMPGHADDCVTVWLGYGRTRAGKVATGVGFNAYALRPSSGMWAAKGLDVRTTGDEHRVAVTQDHQSMEGRDLLRISTLSEYKEHPAGKHHDGAHLFSIYPEWEYKGYSWGMAIDLNACIGCNACTIACQAENNIAVVGKEEVSRGREMHWIRIDRYFGGKDLDNPTIQHQPVTCMHCDNAPCEGVCPVAATTHSEEGLNQMTYNRCVGTRYCANNCPYKVRKFNFFLYQDWDTESLKGVRNPNVTVRSRGVMEKCTYCVQRINTARITAEIEGRRIRDGEVVTACQSVCPSQAIHFGDMNDPNSRIAKVKKDERNYGLLTELNTRPRTSYLAGLRNPNPDLEKG